MAETKPEDFLQAGYRPRKWHRSFWIKDRGVLMLLLIAGIYLFIVVPIIDNGIRKGFTYGQMMWGAVFLAVILFVPCAISMAYYYLFTQVWWVSLSSDIRIIYLDHALRKIENAENADGRNETRIRVLRSGQNGIILMLPSGKEVNLDGDFGVIDEISVSFRGWLSSRERKELLEFIDRGLDQAAQIVKPGKRLDSD